jgi:hypothetical protein
MSAHEPYCPIPHAPPRPRRLNPRRSFARITGVDYVAASVELSREVAAAAGLPHLHFQVRALSCGARARTAISAVPAASAAHAWQGLTHAHPRDALPGVHLPPPPLPPPPRTQEDDVLSSALPDACADLVVDKGTLDAIGLAADGAVARTRYAATVARLLPAGGLLVITSCNATADELAAEFTGGGVSGGEGASPPPPAFAEVERVRTYPVFRFGGQEGTRVATVAFRRL